MSNQLEKPTLPYPYIKAREEAIDKAIEFIKTCPYKGTAIKIELEALFCREGDARNCDTCNASGEVMCFDCRNDMPNCLTCGALGYVRCAGCDGAGRLNAAGRQMSIKQCHEYIMTHISEEAKESTIFSHSYRDGSVDTELTFTLPLEDVRYSVEYINAFKELGDYIGNGAGVNGAGMHIAILNSSNGNYPDGNHLDARRAKNFKYTMTRLLPALFFLASSDHRSRHLNYRRPEISLTSKYGAITGYERCFEYRVFETCYQRPEAILDNLCVIANTLKYYTYRKVAYPFFGKIGSFGFHDYGQGIERFYKSEINYKALMAGVKILKPSYKTIADLRRERNFRVTLSKIKSHGKIKEEFWKKEYVSEKERLDKRLKMSEDSVRSNYEYGLSHPESSGFMNQVEFLRRFPSFEMYLNSTSSHVNLKKQVPTTVDKYLDVKRKQELDNVSVVIEI